jgi:hypothetical protein
MGGELQSKVADRRDDEGKEYRTDLGQGLQEYNPV